MATMVKKEYQLRHGPRLIVLKGSMPDWPEMQLKRTDKPSVIAVVNAANQRLFPGGGVDGSECCARAGRGGAGWGRCEVGWGWV